MHIATGYKRNRSMSDKIKKRNMCLKTMKALNILDIANKNEHLPEKQTPDKLGLLQNLQPSSTTLRA